MVKTSSITDHEALIRLKKIKAVNDTMYHYFQDQDYDTWLTACNMTVELDNLIRILEKRFEK